MSAKNEKLAQYEYDKVPNKEIISEKIESPPKYGYGVRHIQLVIFLLCLTANIIGRAHMGVTIVAMMSTPKENTAILNSTADIKTQNYTKIMHDDLNNNITEDDTDNMVLRNETIEKVALVNTTEKRHKTYDWPKSVQEMVLNAFFLGYMIMMFPMGMVCQRYGGKLPLQIGLLVNAVVSIITPWVAIWGGWKAVCGCRILQGLSQAGTYPGVQALLAKWVPASERATLSSYVYTGLTVGTVVAFQLSGFLGASRWGWPSTFWAIGAIFFICFVLLTVFGAKSPLEHKTITKEERNYIMGDANTNRNAKKLKTPWKAIFTSRPYLANLITHAGTTVCFVFFLNEVPSYIHYILKINLKYSGVLSSLPYVASFFTCLAFGTISDFCTNRNILSVKNARRTFNSIAQLGMASCILLTSYTSSTVVAVSCLVIAMACYMGIHSGWMVNHIDLAPNFSGTLMATGNTVANILVVLTPVVVSHVVTDTANVIQWRIMFFIVAGVSLACNVIFFIFMSSDIQPWNNAEQNDTCIEEAKDEMDEEKEKQ